MSDLTHNVENNEDSQRHLDENRSKFETDAAFLLRMMQRGERLSAKTVVQKYGVADRRLRDLENEGKCQKVWKLNDEGKRLYVEYFVSIPPSPTKQKAIEQGQRILDLLNNNNCTQANLFE